MFVGMNEVWKLLGHFVTTRAGKYSYDDTAKTAKGGHGPFLTSQNSYNVWTRENGARTRVARLAENNKNSHMCVSLPDVGQSRRGIWIRATPRRKNKAVHFWYVHEIHCRGERYWQNEWWYYMAPNVPPPPSSPPPLLPPLSSPLTNAINRLLQRTGRFQCGGCAACRSSLFFASTSPMESRHSGRFEKLIFRH